LKAALWNSARFYGAEVSKYVIDQGNASCIARKKASNVCHEDEEPHLTSVATLATKVGTGDDIDSVRHINSGVVGNELNVNLLNRMASVLNVNAVFRERSDSWADVFVIYRGSGKCQDAIKLGKSTECRPEITIVFENIFL
jgi:hypothetical protein